MGAVLYDRSPVTTRLARRDAGLEDSDIFLLLLDSYHDHERACRFWTNPSGVKGDAIVTGNSAGEGDSSWAPVWDVATEVDDSGWSVEVRIPFSQLRFRPDDEQVWGIQLERNITRTRENATFPITPLLERAGVSRFAHLDRIEGIEGGRRLELLPYVVAQGKYLQLDRPGGVDFQDPYRTGSDHFGNAGIDLKYRVGTNVTLDAAFETRYQERRPFFVEGADIFNFGEGGPRGSVGTGPELVYSRRIGRPPRGVLPADATFDDTPAATTIAAAAKVTGRVGDGWSVGVLEAVTAREVASYTDGEGTGHERTVEPRANHFVGRLRRQIRGGLTRFGMIASAVNRRTAGTALATRLHTSAYSAGVDFAHEWGNRAWLFTSLLSGSYVGGATDAIMRTQRASTHYYQRPGARHVKLDPGATSLAGYYAMAYLGKEAGNFTMRNGVALISPGYEVNDLGFHANSDRVLMDTHYQYTQPNPGDVLRSWGVILGGPNATWNFAGDRLYANINAIGRIELLNYWSTSVRLLYLAPSEDDRLTRGGPMARSPGGWSGNASLNSDGRRTAVVSARYNWGFDDAGGWTQDLQMNLSGRYEETFQFDIDPSYAWSLCSCAVRYSNHGPARRTHLRGTLHIRGHPPDHPLAREPDERDLLSHALAPTLRRALHLDGGL